MLSGGARKMFLRSSRALLAKTTTGIVGLEVVPQVRAAAYSGAV